jgi:hypothetical protein
LITILEESIEQSDQRAQEFEERIALKAESAAAEFGWADKSTAERAQDVLDHPDRFPAYMAPAARAWLKSDPTARVFRKVSA